MCSERVSVQRQGRPVARASAPMRMSSTSKPLPPKPPPTSGAMTRTWSGSSPERRGDARLVLMRRLGREADGQLAVLELRHRRAGLDGRASRRGLSLEPVMMTSQPSNRFSSPAPRDAQARVGARGLEQQDLVLDDLADVGDRGKRVVVDQNQLCRVDRRLARLGHHCGHDLADVADLVGGHRGSEHALVNLEHRRGRAGLQAQIGSGEDLDALERPRLVGIDRRERAVCHRRAHEGHVEGVLHPGVVDVPTPTQEEPRVLPAANPLSDSCGHQALSFPTGPSVSGAFLPV